MEVKAQAQAPLLVLCILSRGRLESLRRAVNSALALAGAPIQVWVFFDDDISTFAAYAPPPKVSKFLLQPRHYYVRGLNAIYEDLKACGMDVFAVGNNDAEWIEPDWAKNAYGTLFQCYDQGMGVLDFGVESNQLSHFISRVPFVEEHLGGRLFDPRFLQYCADTQLIDKLHSMDAYRKKIPGSLFNHEVFDEVKIQGQSMHAQDKLVYEEWKSTQPSSPAPANPTSSPSIELSEA